MSADGFCLLCRINPVDPRSPLFYTAHMTLLPVPVDAPAPKPTSDAPVPLGFKWHWCSQCESSCILCPVCGMNTCSGGYGDGPDGKKCTTCPLAYDFHALADYAKAIPDMRPKDP